MINYNGNLIARSEALIEANNRGLNYGDSVFETLRVSAGKIFFWEDHYFRLMASMRILRMEIPMNFTLEFLESEIQKILAGDTDNKTFRVKILVWRKAGGKYGPSTNDIEYLINYEVLNEPFYTIDDSNYEVELFKDHYVNSGLLSSLKTNNRIINVLGSIYAKENDYHNCLLLNEKKQVIEALNGNIFLVKGNSIKTPPISDGCLNGILRKQLVSICEKLSDYELVQDSVSPFELQKADELFITNVISGIQPISKYRKKEFSRDIARDLLGKLNLKARLG